MTSLQLPLTETVLAGVAVAQVVSAMAKLPVLPRVATFVGIIFGCQQSVSYIITAVTVLLEAGIGLALFLHPASISIIAASTLWAMFALAQWRSRPVGATDAHCYCHGWLLPNISHRVTAGINAAISVILGILALTNGTERIGIIIRLEYGLPLGLAPYLFGALPTALIPWRAALRSCAYTPAPSPYGTRP